MRLPGWAVAAVRALVGPGGGPWEEVWPDEAAFALPRDAVSDPMRAEDGCYIVKVLDIEPMPEDAILLRGMHQDLEAALRQRILEAAKVELL